MDIAPLLFFLKCLDDDSEINDLIKREIKSRNWFILCDSENSRKSKWVQAEIEIIKQYNDKVYETINLDTNLEDQLYKLDRLSKRISIFLTNDWTNENSKIKEIIKSFRKNDYYVYDTEEMRADIKRNNKIWYDAVEENLINATKKGFYFFIITEGLFIHYKEAGYDELRFALENSKTSANIILITLIDKNVLESIIPQEFKTLIENKRLWDFSKGNLEENVKTLIMELKVIEMD